MLLDGYSGYINSLDKFKENIIPPKESNGFINQLDALKKNIIIDNKIKAFECEILNDCNFD